MELDDLEDLFDDDDLGYEGLTDDQLYRVYGIYLTDIVKTPIVIGGRELKFNNSPSKHPLCKGKHQTFEHIITRESKISGKRDFDRERANRIHWIRPIIENVDDPRIKYFEQVNDEGQNQLFFWYEEKAFIVIVREIQPDILLITSFCVDKGERFKFKQRYEEFTGRA